MLTFMRLDSSNFFASNKKGLFVGFVFFILDLFNSPCPNECFKCICNLLLNRGSPPHCNLMVRVLWAIRVKFRSMILPNLYKLAEIERELSLRNQF